jgi:lycopene cyclase domain-containing protein
MEGMENYYYLGLMVFTLSYPLAQSFEHRISFAKKAYALFPAILSMAFVFIVWDHWFTVQGVWGFNEKYLIGWYLLELPLEEWLFFLIVPYACVFIYEVLIFFVKKDLFKPLSVWIMYLLIGVLLSLGIYYLDKLYTGINFLFTSIVLAVHLFIFRDKHFGRFFLAYLVSFIPFFFVNGVLTGSWIDEPIVWYNDQENLGIRLGTIPVEDAVYNLGMLLMVVTIYEKIKERKTFQKGNG